MADLPCNLNLRIDPTFGQEELVFRTDSDIPQPVALLPQDNAHYCLDAQRGNNSHIALSWTLSAGATLYVLQWSDSQDMQGGSLRQKILATNAYALIRNEDIRLGETIFWRVFALNTSGGISLPSQPRQLTYSCEGMTDGDPDKSADFNVEVELLGPTTIRHCEDTTYYIKLSFTNKDANDREICTFDGCEWEVDFIGSATGLGSIDMDTGNELKVYVNARLDGDVSGNLEIKATLTFTDLITEEEFTKEVKMEAIVEPFNYGCGLTCTEVCVDDNPYELTYRVGLDFESIAGYGLEVYDPRDLDPEHPGYDPCGCPQLQIAKCLIVDDLYLAPGVYRAIAGEDVAPGAVGTVVYGLHEVSAENNSECPVEAGDRVNLFISPDCDIFFSLCKCCSDDNPYDCCNMFMCVNGIPNVLRKDGTIVEYDVTQCCTCDGASLTAALTCVDNEVTIGGVYTCGETTEEWELAVAGACADEFVPYQTAINVGGCSIDLYISNVYGTCETCPTTYCDNDCIQLSEQEYVCIEQDCENPEYSPEYEVVFTSDRQVICPGDEFTLTAVYTPIDPMNTGPFGVSIGLLGDLGVHASVVSYSPSFVPGPPEGSVSGASVYWGLSPGDTFSVTYLWSALFTKALCDSIEEDNAGVFASTGADSDRHRATILRFSCCPIVG